MSGRERVTSTSPPMTTMDKVTQQISIKILAHLVNKNLLQMCFRCKYAFFVLFLNQNWPVTSWDFKSHQKPASIIFVTKYVTFMLDFRVIYVTHVTYVIIYVTCVTYMICYKYDPTELKQSFKTLKPLQITAHLILDDKRLPILLNSF